MSPRDAVLVEPLGRFRERQRRLVARLRLLERRPFVEQSVLLAELRDLGLQGIELDAPHGPTIAVALVGLLQGAGATQTSLRINLIGTVLVQIPLGIFLAFGLDWGVFGVWVSFPMSFVVKAALSFGAYKRGKWAKVGADA